MDFSGKRTLGKTGFQAGRLRVLHCKKAVTVPIIYLLKKLTSV